MVSSTKRVTTWNIDHNIASLTVVFSEKCHLEWLIVHYAPKMGNIIFSGFYRIVFDDAMPHSYSKGVFVFTKVF